MANFNEKLIDDLFNHFLNRINNMKEGEKLPWFKPWKTNPSLAYSFNLVTGYFYTGINAIMFESGGYISYKHAKEYGLRIKYSEVNKPKVGFYYFKTATEKTKDLPEEDKVYVFYPKPFRVYHISQLEEAAQLKAKELFSSLNEKESKKELLKKSKDFIKNMKLLDNYISSLSALNHGGDKAFYMSANDTVTMPNIEQFESEDHYFAVLCHELSHSTGHKNRLNRKLSNTFGSKDYAFEELIAELSASMLCALLGEDYLENSHTLENSTAYLVSWMKTLKENDIDYLKKAFISANASAKYILKTIDN